MFKKEKQISFLGLILIICIFNSTLVGATQIGTGSIDVSATNFVSKVSKIKPGKTAILSTQIKNIGSRENVVQIKLNNVVTLSNGQKRINDSTFDWRLAQLNTKKLMAAYNKNGQRSNNYFYIKLQPNETFDLDVRVSIPLGLSNEYNNANFQINAEFFASQQDPNAITDTFMLPNFYMLGAPKSLTIINDPVAPAPLWFFNKVTKTTSFSINMD